MNNDKDNPNNQVISAPEDGGFDLAVTRNQYLNPTLWKQMTVMAGTLQQSGLLPKGIDTVQKAIVVMQVGLEMGLKPMQAFSYLYPVNGIVNIYGKACAAMLQKAGYDIDYVDEKPGEVVTAVVTDRKTNKEYRFTYSFKDAEDSGITMQEEKNWDNSAKRYVNSGKKVLKAGWMPGSNRTRKLRYGALSAIINTQLAHVLDSVGGIVEVSEDYVIEGEVVNEEANKQFQDTMKNVPPVPTKKSLKEFQEAAKQQKVEAKEEAPQKEEEVKTEKKEVTKSEEKPKANSVEELREDFVRIATNAGLKVNAAKLNTIKLYGEEGQKGFNDLREDQISAAIEAIQAGGLITN